MNFAMSNSSGMNSPGSYIFLIKWSFPTWTWKIAWNMLAVSLQERRLCHSCDLSSYPAPLLPSQYLKFEIIFIFGIFFSWGCKRSLCRHFGNSCLRFVIKGRFWVSFLEYCDSTVTFSAPELIFSGHGIIASSGICNSLLKKSSHSFFSEAGFFGHSCACASDFFSWNL